MTAKGLRLLVAGFVALALIATALPSDADLADDIRKLQEEREALEQDRATKAKAIDTATAEANELAEALGVLNGQVSEQEDKLARAQVQLAAAENRYAAASQAVVNKTAEIRLLKVQVSARAITAFVDQNVGSTPVLENVDPNKAVRMQSLVQSITRQEVDVAEQLRRAREDLALEEAEADRAAEEAEDFRAAIERQRDALKEAQADLAELVEEAEWRLEARLAEAAIMAERDKAISVEITEKNAELQRQAELARRRASNPAPRSQGNAKFPTADQLRQVRKFWVHEDIAENLRAMLDAAEADGITFGGWGYRDHAAQIRLRKAHCGTSNYAIYSKPSSTCRPPTARPGSSQHELGKAIDFTYGGSTIGTRSSPGFKWLKANAARYGFYNLPSEPWHWSVNGR